MFRVGVFTRQHAAIGRLCEAVPDGRPAIWTFGHTMAIFPRMSTYSVADAKNHLPQLIDRALDGESVVITRHGNPVVELRAIPAPPRPVTQADIDWLDTHRVGKTPAPIDAGNEVSRMRDEDSR